MSLRTLLLCLACVLFGMNAFGQTDVEKEEAQKRFDEGLKLHDTGNDNEARLKFAQAWAVLKRPNVLFNLARSEQLSSHPVEALVHFEDFVKMPGISSQDKDDADRRIVELKKQVGTVDVKGAPEGAKIVIDDQWTGKTAPALEEIHALPGKRIIEVRTSTKSYRKEVTCEASQTTVVSFEEEVRLNPPDGYIPPDTGPRPYASGRIPTVVALGVLGAGGIILGAALGASSSSKKDDTVKMYSNTGACANQSSSSCAPVMTARSDQSTLATLSVVGYIAGGVFLAGAAAAFLFWPRKKADAPTVGISVTPQGGSFVLQGSF